VAIVALARKILCILHHLLMNREMYEADGEKKKVEIDLDEKGDSAGMSVEDMIRYVVKAGYDVKKKSGMGE
jgi:major membrane immunogen (membrane-anchored lipoprotein)